MLTSLVCSIFIIKDFEYILFLFLFFIQILFILFIVIVILEKNDRLAVFCFFLINRI